MKENRAGLKLDRKQIFHSTLSGSSATISMLRQFTPCFIQYFIAMTPFRILEL